MSKLEIAVAGAGLIGRRHIELIQASPSCKLVAIVDPSPAAAEIARNAQVPLYAALGALLKKQRPDGVILATPNQMHAEQALQCIGAGTIKSASATNGAAASAIQLAKTRKPSRRPDRLRSRMSFRAWSS